MARCLLLELNTRCWLSDWSACLRRPIGLAQVPDQDLDSWARLGFTHLWLMGLWTTGPLSRRVYAALPNTQAELDRILPGWTADDIAGSPYAIERYAVPESLGGDDGLQRFRERARSHGLRILLDFVPNHVGLDHPWVRQHPGWFVAGSPGASGSFQVDPGGSGEPRWIAHGKDPSFPAWIDTAQLDYRLPEVRAAMTRQLVDIAQRCDGVRCDMAMLELQDVFARAWQASPPLLAAAPGEFWSQAIHAVRAGPRQDFLFVAEAYWDLEDQLLDLGFDLAYDKRVTDFIMERNGPALARHLQTQWSHLPARRVRFLENHDEPRAAARLTLAEHRAAALLALALPGMPWIHDGQLTGARARVPVQLRRRPAEPVDEPITQMYSELLAARAASTCLGQGTPRLLQARKDPASADAGPDPIIIEWADPEKSGDFDWVVVNLAPVGGRWTVPCERVGSAGWNVSSRLPDATQKGATWSQGEAEMRLELAPQAATWLAFSLSRPKAG